MAKPFSLQTIIRKVPNNLLQEFFHEMKLDTSVIDWAHLTKGEIDPILGYLNELPKKDWDLVEPALHNISELSTETGFNAILESALVAEIENLATQFPSDLDFYGRAMWTWINHREIFEDAQSIYQVDNLSWWRKRNDLPKIELELPRLRIQTPAEEIKSNPIERLERAISNLLKKDGRGKECTVEVWSRGKTHYFFAHPDDFVENTNVHEKGVLTTKPFRKTFLIAFAYDEDAGTLELFTKSQKQSFKEDLERTFSKEVLGWDLGPHDPGKAFELNHLKDSAFLLETDPQDGVRAQIVKMRLAVAGTGRRIMIEVDRHSEFESIHKAIGECLNFDAFPFSRWNATQVSIHFEFAQQGQRKAGRNTIDVCYPRTCSMRSAKPDRVEIIQKYLKRWKIDFVPTNESTPVALGA